MSVGEGGDFDAREESESWNFKYVMSISTNARGWGGGANRTDAVVQCFCSSQSYRFVMTHRLSISFSDDDYSFLIEAYRRLDEPTISRFVSKMVGEYRMRDKAAHPNEPKREPRTDREKLFALLEEIATLRQEINPKIIAIREIRPKKLDGPENESDIKRYIDAIWDVVVDRGGYTVVGGKVIPLTWDDLQRYGEFHRLQIRKDNFADKIKASQTKTAPAKPEVKNPEPVDYKKDEDYKTDEDYDKLEAEVPVPPPHVQEYVASIDPLTRRPVRKLIG